MSLRNLLKTESRRSNQKQENRSLIKVSWRCWKRKNEEILCSQYGQVKKHFRQNP